MKWRQQQQLDLQLPKRKASPFPHPDFLTRLLEAGAGPRSLLRSYRDPEVFQDQPFKNKQRLLLYSSFAPFLLCPASDELRVKFARAT
jgi:hypothetical protein